jgi:hypothetical protein
MLNVSSDVPFTAIGLVPNDFAILGATMAVSDAVADPPPPEFVPPSVVEMNPLTLVCGPAVAAITFTLAVHDPLAGMFAPVVCPKLTVVDPAAGAQVGETVQVVLAEGGDAT